MLRTKSGPLREHSTRPTRVTDMKHAPTDYEELYASQYRPLVGLLVALGSTPADAEEVAQETFIKALQRWRRIRRYDDPPAWLRLVAVRAMKSQLRKEARREEIERDLPIEAPAPTLTECVDLTDAVGCLSPAHRQVIVLHYGVDLPVADIARLLRVPIGTIQSRLHRARVHLAELLTLEENENA